MSRPVVTSVRVDRDGGPHARITVWNRGANAGTLTVQAEDADAFKVALLAARVDSSPEQDVLDAAKTFAIATDNYRVQLERYCRETGDGDIERGTEALVAEWDRLVGDESRALAKARAAYRDAALAMRSAEVSAFMMEAVNGTAESEP